MTTIAELEEEIRLLKNEVKFLTKTNLAQQKRHDKSYSASARSITFLEQENVRLADQVFDLELKLDHEKRKYWNLRRELTKDIISDLNSKLVIGIGTKLPTPMEAEFDEF